MTLLWEGTPVFAAEQHISAAGQLNALGKGAQLLFDRVTGYAAPFSGYRSGEDVNAGWQLRHKWNRFEWEYYLASGTAYLAINGVKLTGTEKTGAGWHSGTEDISGLNLTPNAFYPVSMTTTGDVQVYKLAERSHLTFPTLTTFSNGTTPNAGQWNDLGVYTDLLHQETAGPRPLFGANWQSWAGKAWLGCFVKTGSRWVYQFQMQTPYHAAANGDRYAKALLRAYHATTGEKLLATWEMNAANAGPGETRRFAGVLDVTAAGFPHGETVRLWVDFERSTEPDFYGGLWVDRLWQIADDNPTLSTWQAIPTWTQPGYVTDVDKLRNDLVRLKSAYQPLNFAQRAARPATPNGTGPYTEAFRAQRLHRWLHYICKPKDGAPNETDAQPMVTWDAGGGEKSTSLPAATTWGVFDLASQEGLYPGLLYSVKDVLYALEDFDA